MSSAVETEIGRQQPSTDIDPIDYKDVQAVIRGIRDASTAASDLVLPPNTGDGDGAEPDNTEDDGSSYYWDASTMAALSAASAVSTCVFTNPHPPPRATLMRKTGSRLLSLGLGPSSHRRSLYGIVCP